MTDQTCPACGGSKWMRFVSGGSATSGITGAYIMCHVCMQEFEIYYNTGKIKMTDNLEELNRAMGRLPDNLDPNSRYYDVGGIEVLNVIKAKLTPDQYTGYLLGCVIKYSLRLNWKHTTIEGYMRDSQKMETYAKNLRQHFHALSGGNSND